MPELFTIKCRIFLFILLLYSFYTQAQLCNNNLGDPIVNLTFGTKEDPQQPSSTTFNFVEGCPSRGEYTINDFLFGCGGFWVAMTGDNTPPPDLNGNYMLVNAESTSGTILEETATGLCENMTYQFSAYVTNVLQDNLSCSGSAVLPNLTFVIESLSGTVLASYNTGNIPITNEKKWVQYGFTYKTSTGTNAVVLKITTAPQYGCGNAFAIDDVVFQNCGPAVSVTIDGSIEAQNVCAGYNNPFIMQGSYSAGFINPAVQWQNSFDTGKTWKDIPGAVTTVYQVPNRDAGVIEYRIVVAEKENINTPACRMRSNAIYTEVHPLPPHQSPRNISGCTGEDYALPPADYKAFYVEWKGPNGYSSTEYNAIISNLQYADTGLYVMKQTFDFGCTNLDSVYVGVKPGITLIAQPTHPVCEGESETLVVTASDIGSYKWTPSTGLSNDTAANPVATPADSVIYKVIVTNAGGCQDSAFLPVEVYKKPLVNAGPDKTIFSGDSVVLDATLKGTALNYYWSPPVSISDVNAVQPIVNPAQNITYTLTATSTVGCGNTSDDASVFVFKGFFIPNAFTPNGDGLNDKFKILTYNNYTIKRFAIYNRWGAVIFNTTKPGEGWNGTYKGFPQPMGSYVYYLEIADANNKIIIKRGTISLIR